MEAKYMRIPKRVALTSGLALAGGAALAASAVAYAGAVAVTTTSQRGVFRDDGCCSHRSSRYNDRRFSAPSHRQRVVVVNRFQISNQSDSNPLNRSRSDSNPRQDQRGENRNTLITTPSPSAAP
jgi:hypothetical protein